MTGATDRTAAPLADPVRHIAAGGSFRSELKPGADVVDPEHWTS